MPRTPGPRGLLSETIALKISPGQRQELEAAAFVQGISEQEVVRLALDEFLGHRRRHLRPVLKSVQAARRAAQD